MAYAAHENATRAVRDAGYSTKDASSLGYRLIRKPEIKEYVDNLIAEKLKKFEISGERILEELAKIAFSDISEFISRDGVMSAEDFERLTPAQRACIASVKRSADGSYEIKLHDKLAALDKLGRSQKLFTDKIESEHKFTQMGSVQVGDQPMQFNVGEAPDPPNTKH